MTTITWNCNACPGAPEFTHDDMMKHLKEVHQINPQVDKGSREMTTHLDGRDFYASIFKWTIRDLTFTQTISNPRGKAARAPKPQAKPKPAPKSDQQIIDETKQALNKYPAGRNYRANQRLLAIVTSALDKVLDKPGRNAFLSYMFDRTIQTSRMNEPMQAVRRIQPDGSEIVDRVIKAETTNGLEPHEHFALLTWGQPGKLTEDAPWQVEPRVRTAALAFQRLGLGQIDMFKQESETE